ncbi:cupin domain-containing protein [Xenorhabdus sp. PB61.4]|uniref:cupin domain-containing protein n=1 Tax=Xenorhabdus sp. PB61.4 TaxID=2788940 RepID=UPI001E3D4913|nr:cupin domain-containing protein [Xenorhabdus sp. PB61.4]MCC8364974.1 cupin domain-containing protein [Xenorhabdus sp. PB61.4]
MSSYPNNNIKEQTPAILSVEEGEQLTRRWGYPLTIKVDPVTTGAKRFSVGTEDIPPGKVIPRHRHTHSEELIIVQSGSVIAHIGNERRALSAGGMAYAPENTWMGFENRGNTTATIIWIFTTPGFEEYVRATSVPSGDPVIPLSASELVEIRKKYKSYIELEGGNFDSYPTDVKNKK